MAAGSGWAARRLFAVNSPAIGNKNNAADRPSPVDHRPQGVMLRVLKVEYPFRASTNEAKTSARAQSLPQAEKKDGSVGDFPRRPII